MPQPRIDGLNQHYDFTQAESIAARQVPLLQAQWLNTKYAMLMSQKASIPCPANPEEDRKHFLDLAVLEGRMEMIQEILDDSIAAMHELTDLKSQQTNPNGAPIAEINIDDVSAKAASQVHNS